MGKFFGTDGIRGIANTELSALLALKIGAASAYVLRKKKHGGAEMLIGRDSRISGDILESAMAAGICSLGVDVHLAGIVPTPAVAFLSNYIQADAGIVISASHNQMRDNGIKFFGGNGYKLNDGIETEIEAAIEHFDDLPLPEGSGVGRMYRTQEDLVDRYYDHLMQIAGFPLKGMKIAADCSNGAVFQLAPRIFLELGADLTVINDKPDGLNINLNCGSLCPEALQELVVKSNADIGIAFDGDGDRAILVDEKGNLADGDHVLAICALDLARKGMLTPKAIVATVMSNIGLEIALGNEGISMVRTQVGDRYVADEMKKSGIILGGEQSGHVIFSNHSTTGDGIVTALQILGVMRETGKTLSELTSQMEAYPQLLVNIPVKRMNGWEDDPSILAAIKDGERRLAGKGRVFVRASGTEKLIRVMAEGPDMEEIDEITGAIAEEVKKALA